MNRKSYLVALSLIATTSLLGASRSLAGSSEALKCKVQNSADRIVEVQVQETDLEGQIAASTVIQKSSQSEETLTRVSNGSLMDQKIFLFETSQIGIGSVHRYLERNRKSGEFTISLYFQCDWINDEEHCPPGGGDLEYRGESGIVSCERSK